MSMESLGWITMRGPALWISTVYEQMLITARKLTVNVSVHSEWRDGPYDLLRNILSLSSYSRRHGAESQAEVGLSFMDNYSSLQSLALPYYILTCRKGLIFNVLLLT